jgi:chromosome partitioning protein
MPAPGVCLAIANCKGGSGKSTAAVILAGEYMARGARVHLVDADPRRRLSRWAEAGMKPAAITVSEANANTMREAIAAGLDKADLVIVDVEGSQNAALTLAVAYASAALIPANISPPDVEDALATVSLVRDMADAARRTIPHGILWSCVPAAIRSREMLSCELAIDQALIPVLGRVYQRAAFSALFSFSTVLDQLPASQVSGLDKAKADAVKLTDAVSMLVGANLFYSGVAA